MDIEKVVIIGASNGNLLYTKCSAKEFLNIGVAMKYITRGE